VTLPALIALKPRQRHKTDLDSDSDSDSDSEILVSYVNNMRSAVVHAVAAAAVVVNLADSAGGNQRAVLCSMSIDAYTMYVCVAVSL